MQPASNTLSTREPKLGVNQFSEVAVRVEFLADIKIVCRMCTIVQIGYCTYKKSSTAVVIRIFHEPLLDVTNFQKMMHQ